jgi:tetratricopeptide (TPR) repeat protein
MRRKTLVLLGIVISGLLPAWAGELFDQGLVKYKQKDFATATKLFQSATTQEANNARVWFYLGLAQARQSKLAEARQSFEKAQQLLYKDPNADLSEKVRNNIAYITQEQLKANGSAARNIKQVAAPATDHYLPHAIANGQVVNWVRMPIRVFIDRAPQVPGWKTAFSGLAQQACQTWQGAANGKIRFQFVAEAENADIRIHWQKAFEHQKIGENPFVAVNNKIVRSDVTVATHVGDTPLTSQQVLATLLHEMGHALGIQGHSPEAGDIMFYASSPNQQATLSARDKKTLQKLYEASPDIRNASARKPPMVATQAQSAKPAASFVQLMRQAVSAQTRQDHPAAIALYQQAARLQPHNPDLHYNWGLAYQHTGNTDQALTHYRQALKHDPKRLDARYNMAALLVNQGIEWVKQGKQREAQQAFQEAVQHYERVASHPKRPPETGQYLAVARKNWTLAQQP